MSTLISRRTPPVRRGIADVVKIKPSAEASPVTVPSAKSQAICVASGKGGTGKTVFSINIGVVLSRAGFRVTLVDADLGLANLHLLLGLDPMHDVSQLISGERSIDEVLMEGPHGLRVLPGGSGIAELAELNEGQIGYFAHQLMRLEDETDIILIDCSAGITRQVLRFMASAHEIVVVITPEITSMIDGYAVIKNIHRFRPNMHVRIVVNRVQERMDSKAVFKKMKEVVSRRLGEVTMSLLGEIPHDRYVLRSIGVCQPVVELHPRCFATSCFTRMAHTLGDAHKKWKTNQEKGEVSMPSYFSSLAGRFHE